MARIYVWLRYSAVRQLTWQRNYNTQVRRAAQGILMALLVCGAAQPAHCFSLGRSAIGSDQPLRPAPPRSARSRASWATLRSG